MLESFLFEIKDKRRGQGKQYQLGHILLISILAILSNADSYRKIHQFIKIHYKKLNAEFGFNWKNIPAYTTIRNVIQGCDRSSLEKEFRNYSKALIEEKIERKFIAFDGKTLRGSFDHFNDKRAIQILSVFLTESKIILAHQDIDEKTNEIPTAQKLMQELGIENCIFTFDAMNCQKNSRSC